MLITKKIAAQMENGSWIRRMFEAGIQLKNEFGEDAVCDFSLGNPDLAPPTVVGESLHRLADRAGEPFSLGYMPNAGFGWAREKLAAYISAEQGTQLSGSDLILTCGAAGGLNILFKSVLEPEDEVLAIRPYFVEYGSYVGNHGGVLKTVAAKPDTFALDIEGIANAITAKTRAVLINSPNNPTGAVYSEKELRQLVTVLETASKQHGRPVFLIADEPYRFLAYDSATVPSLLPMYDHAVVVSSFSKNLSLAGERLGFVVLSPRMKGRETLMAALTLTNRILGFVNPPVVGQHIMADALGSQVDAAVYARRRDLMADVLRNAGYDFTMPAGAFYFFPKAPGGDDLRFVNENLLKERILAVPGTGFGGPGHFRLAFCVQEEVILRSAEGFARAIRA